jgi:dienelactone hydrolase
MRFRKTIGLAVVVGLLVAGAVAFQFLVPANFWMPEIEVAEPGSTGVRVNSNGLFGNYYPATGEGRHPAILLLGGSEGGLARGVQQMALSLQSEGFAVLQLGYFGVPGAPDSLERIPLELFDRGLAWLAAQPGVDGARLALVGGSKGAEAVLLAATRNDRLRAVVAGMPTSVVWKGINWSRGGQSPYSSWTSGGVELPTMPYAGWNMSDGIISVYRSVEDPAQRAQAERAAIPVERSRATLMLVCGEAETMWPACPMSRLIEARAAQRGGPRVQVLAYRDAGHLLFGPPIPRTSTFFQQLDMFGGTVEGNAAARIDGWPRVITFLKAETAAR